MIDNKHCQVQLIQRCKPVRQLVQMPWEVAQSHWSELEPQLHRTQALAPAKGLGSPQA